MAEDEVKLASPLRLPLEFAEWNSGMVFDQCFGLLDADGETADVHIGIRDFRDKKPACAKAAYIVHAANEYPRLRERVRELEAALEAEKQGD